MTTIRVDMPVVTLVNVFTVEPENQQRLTELLIEATEKTIRHFPGFVSANIHKSLDGKHVANYAQWRREEDWRAMLADPDARVHMKGALELATLEGHMYRVAYCDEHEEK
jgi:antibiotic biosynthesis monooxygenase (ABM) superfamily enzyme